jgi:hypothetical protein
VLGAIPKSEIAELKGYNNSEPLLLISDTPNSPTVVLYYINNIFFGSQSFKEAYKTLAIHLLPRIL